jgi:hypothetical protein
MGGERKGHFSSSLPKNLFLRRLYINVYALKEKNIIWEKLILYRGSINIV